jgi:hypothetical protein
MKTGLIVFGFLLLGCLVFVYGWALGDEAILTSTISPAQKYRVDITQKYKGIERYVYLVAYRNDEQFVPGKLLFTGDQFDGAFLSRYPEYSWVSESILKVGQATDDPQSNGLRIANRTSKQIRYLLIETYEDKYVLFDVEPWEVVGLNLTFRGRLSGQCEFLGETRRIGGAVKLRDNSEKEVLGDFLIEVREMSIDISSGELELKNVTCCAADRPDMFHE